jgi:hypothetical protein
MWRPGRAAGRRKAARRLVPVDELRAVAAALLDVAEAVETWQLAEHFDVTEAVAHQRVDELRRRRLLQNTTGDQ